MYWTANLRALALGLSLVAIGPQLASAETWAQKLGYGPNARVLILAGHEMGVSWEMNEAGKDLLNNQRLQSVSVVSTGPWFNDFAIWCRENPGHDVGLNFALTNPYDRIDWKLLSPEGSASSLVNGDGFPWKTVFQLACFAKPEDVERELHAQIARARAAGIPLSHLSGYYGTVFARTDLAAVLLRTSEKHWIPTPVVDLTPELIERFRQQGFPLPNDLIELVRNYPLPKVDDIQFMPKAATYEEKRDALCELLRGLPPGLTEIVIHPAVATPGLERLTPVWQQRVWEHQLLRDEVVQQTLQDQLIRTTDWREIMQRFEGGAAEESGE
jgi:predicted glycoside hydrolase/deacetylase ChbG (UPF0249 family)